MMHTNAAARPASAPETTADQANAAVKAVLRIAERWQLGDADLGIALGGVSVPTITRWRMRLRRGQPTAAQLDRDRMDRISYLLGIYKALHILFLDETQADRWIHRPVELPGMEGRSAIEVIRGGSMDDLRHVRRFLDGWRG
ncbi:antitoxin Xre-like helix-turn-helix domain-containing protein [Salinisphaera sp. Q1T1-3]|uniref:antitoxin Xre-like helix-turn-helix domain-containing protein n=1 Tax=Salinisphaera sp. Q1T1-3 TaxID=2321229 RepID=UPI000E7488F5|nr:antitoxin Xre-like helix-turn-helix domain-containing protein [Salinisphaera sp. Q1T1-3]RJS92694.1 DUF2384 domain-containing protein [Salinisphaera sp. Q1T1-3]